MSQSIHATTPSSTGDPVPAEVQGTDVYLSPPRVANARQTCSWSPASTLMQNDPVSRIFGKLVDDRSGRNATSGGSRDTEVNDPTAMPTGPAASCSAVTTTTPVGKCPRTWRKRPGSIATALRSSLVVVVGPAITNRPRRRPPSDWHL